MKTRQSSSLAPPRSTVAWSVVAVWVGSMIALSAWAQPVQQETDEIGFTGKVIKVDLEASTVSIMGSGGEWGDFHIEAGTTTIMSGNQKVALSALHPGEWVVVNGNKRDRKDVATYIEVVEDPRPPKKKPRALATAQGAGMAIGSGKFVPKSVRIAAGQSVTFTNIGQAGDARTVEAVDGAFSSPALSKGESWSHSFDVPGTYGVRLKGKPAVKGSIVVFDPDEMVKKPKKAKKAKKDKKDK